jgi:hypothetical protein
MILVCHDCHHDVFTYQAREWRYPCETCAQAFLESHKATGHDIRARPERPSDKHRFSGS